MLTAAQIPTEDETTVTTPKTNSNMIQSSSTSERLIRQIHSITDASKHTWQSWTAEDRWHCSLYSPELLASGKTEASLRLYCSVRLATLYKLPLVEKPKPSAWPDPKTATSHGELLFPPHMLLSGSTVAESGRENCAALWGKDPQRETMTDFSPPRFK